VEGIEVSDLDKDLAVTPEQTEAARKLHAAHRRFVEADEALADPTKPIAAAVEYLVARNLHQEAIREVEAAFAPLMP
jgi:hypothetical protein